MKTFLKTYFFCLAIMTASFFILPPRWSNVIVSPSIWFLGKFEQPFVKFRYDRCPSMIGF